MLYKIRDFADTEWSKIYDALVAKIPLDTVIEELSSKVNSMRAPLEKKVGDLDDQEIFALLILRQLDTFLKVCARDGTAPIISSIVHFVEDVLYDAMVAAIAGRKSEAATLRDLVTEPLSIFEYEHHWDFYVHTLLSLQRIYSMLKHQGAGLEGFVQWSKKMGRILERALAMRGRTLNFYLPPYHILRGHIPARITPETARKISASVYDLWLKVRKRKVPLKLFAPIEGEEKGEIWADFYEGLIRTVNERMNRKFGLPPIDVPITVRVVYDREAQLTTSVAHFKKVGDNYIATFFKPEGKVVAPAEEAHLVFHEVVPGHAYAEFLESKFRFGVTPLSEAWATCVKLSPSFVDVFSVVHEGWALLAQELGTNLLESDEVRKGWVREILLYVERALVIEKTLPFYTVKPHISRIADPFQFSAYFYGYIVFKSLIKKEGLAPAIKAITNGTYPYIPTEKEIIDVINQSS